MTADPTFLPGAFLPRALLALALFLPLSAQAQNSTPSLMEQKTAARVMADWAIEEQRAEVLGQAIALLLRSGASDVAGPPDSVHDLLGALRAMPGGLQLAEWVLADRARGVALGGGNSRIELALEAGEVHRETLVMAGGEPALIEVRLYRGSDGADAELTIRDAGGTVIGSDLGPETGIEGQMAFVEFTPEDCVSVEVQIRNAGQGAGRMVVLAPPTFGQGCG